MRNPYDDALIKARIEAPNRAIDEAEFMAKFGPCPTTEPVKSTICAFGAWPWNTRGKHCKKTTGS